MELAAHGALQFAGACTATLALCSSLVPAPALGQTADAAAGAAQDRGNEIIVAYDAGTDLEAVLDTASIDASSSRRLVKDVDGTSFALVTLAEHEDADDAMARLEQDPAIASAERNRTLHAHTTEVNDEFATDEHSYYLSTERVRDAWDLSKANGAVTVAVLDSGVTKSTRYRNADLAANIDFDHAWDTTRGLVGKLLSSSTIDYLGHGTAVSSLIAAEADNETGIAGTSYNAKVLPIRVMDKEGATSTEDLVIAYGYILEHACELNVKVVNMSLGGPAEDAGDMSALQMLIDTACEDYGILSIASAGNEGDTFKEYPASLDHVVSVGAVDKYSVLADWSQRNNAVDLVAAGVDVYIPEEWPFTVEINPRGEEIASKYYAQGNYTSDNGTSFATPVVSGIAALLYAADASLTAAQAEAALETTATDLGSAGKDSKYGYGEVNAAAAVQAVLGKKVSKLTLAPTETSAFSKTTPKLKTVTGKSKKFKATWKAVQGISGYKLYYRKAGASSWKSKTVSASKHSITISGLKKKTKYQVRIRAYGKSPTGKVWTKYSAKKTVKTK